jgi:hypothetical protein
MPPIPVAEELENRFNIWRTLGNAGDAKPPRLRELGIYGAAQGIWVDKKRTASISPEG